MTDNDKPAFLRSEKMANPTKMLFTLEQEDKDWLNEQVNQGYSQSKIVRWGIQLAKAELSKLSK